MRYTTPVEDMTETVRTLTEKTKLGEMLIEANLLTEDALRQALQDQPKSHMKLGRLLVRKGLVSEGDLVEIVSRQLEHQSNITPDKYPLDPTLAQFIPIEQAQQHQIAPVRKGAAADHRHHRSAGHRCPRYNRNADRLRGGTRDRHGAGKSIS